MTYPEHLVLILAVVFAVVTIFAVVFLITGAKERVEFRKKLVVLEDMIFDHMKAIGKMQLGGFKRSNYKPFMRSLPFMDELDDFETPEPRMSFEEVRDTVALLLDRQKLEMTTVESKKTHKLVTKKKKGK